MKIECYFDGACQPSNPNGAMGIGALVKKNGVRVWEFSKFYPARVGNTNNIAEYIGLANILHYLKENGLDEVETEIIGDSQLVIKQMNEEWGMKGGGYVPYAIKCMEKVKEFKVRPIFKWVKRDLNTEADELSTREMKANNVTIKDFSSFKK